MKYIRTKHNTIDDLDKIIFGAELTREDYIKAVAVKEADTIEDLIQIGDIVFYWSSSDDKEHCSLMTYDADIVIIRNEPITKLLIPVGEDYKCVAKGYPSFNLIKNRRYLVNKGELELL